MTEQLEEYITRHIDPEPDNLYRLDRDTHLRLLYSRMCSGHLQDARAHDQAQASAGTGHL